MRAAGAAVVPPRCRAIAVRTSLPGGNALPLAREARGRDAGRESAHNGNMGGASDHRRSHQGQRLWQQQVQLSRGHWRREEAAGTTRSAGWWESVTVTWSPAAAPERRSGVLQRALATAADIIVPRLADAAVTGARRMLERRHAARPVPSASRRQLPFTAGALPRSDRNP